MDKIRWGVLSTAKHGRLRVIPATQRSQFGTVTAIASRDLSRAKSVAAELDIEKAYGSYQQLLADKEVDAVFIPLPNHLHVNWSIRALKAGKHVLCEKPIGLNVAEAEQLAGAAAAHPELKIMEAFMYRFHPQWHAVRQLVHEGRIGRLRTVHTAFSYYNDDPQNIRNQRDIGGGALMDIGCYPISMARFLFDAEPLRVLGHMERDPKTEVDRLTSAVLEFFQGTATFTVSTQLVPYQRTHIYGTTGRIEVEIPVNAPHDRPCRMWAQMGQQPEKGDSHLLCEAPSGPSRQKVAVTFFQQPDAPVEEIRFDACDQYTLQADAFMRAIIEDTPVPTPIADAVANMRVIERVATSAAKNVWE